MGEVIVMLDQDDKEELEKKIEGIKVPTKTSQLENDSAFITKTVNDLAYYYLKSETYSKAEVDNKLSVIPKFEIKVVSNLPTTDISTTTVYLLKSGDEAQNLYSEYIYVNNAWEYLGKQTVDLSGYALKTDVPTKLSDLFNDSGFLTNTVTNLVNYYTKTESDNKYQPKGNYLTQHQDLSAYAKTSQIPSKTSQLTNDSNFLTEKPIYTASEVGADAKGTAQTKVLEHNVSEESHGDIRRLVAELTTRLNTLANSDDITLDQMAEVVAYIKNNKGLIDAITTSKISVSDIIDNLTTSTSNKPLSAKQGVALKALIDGLSEEIDDLKENGIGLTAEQLAQLETNPLYGKKVSFLGDSICAGSDATYLGGYGKIIADRNNMTYQNLGKGGSTVTAETYSSTNGTAKGWLCRMVDNMDTDTDYAIIEGGVNDAWQLVDHDNLTIGEISNGYNATLDETTYYGAFESMLKKLITRFQGKKIGYIAIPRTMSFYSNSENVPNFYHIAIECCAKWGVPVCDLNTITPPTACLGTEYVADGTHPTYEGYLKYYCDPIEAWMKTLTTGGNNTASVAIKAIEEYTKGFNDAIKALQDGKLNNTGISFRKALLPLADGTTIEIDVLTALDGSVVIPYINRVPLSIDTDGSVFNGVGYEKDLRLSSSGVTKSQAGSYVTGYIPATNGDVIRVFGCDWGTTLNAMNYICAYDANFNFIGARATVQGSSALTGHGTSIISNTSDYSVDDDLNLTLTLNCTATIAYIRVSSKGDTTGNVTTFEPKDMIVTVNEEIK